MECDFAGYTHKINDNNVFSNISSDTKHCQTNIVLRFKICDA